MRNMLMNEMKKFSAPQLVMHRKAAGVAAEGVIAVLQLLRLNRDQAPPRARTPRP